MIKKIAISMLAALAVISASVYGVIAEAATQEKEMCITMQTKGVNEMNVEEAIFDKGIVNPYGKYFVGQSYLAMLTELNGVGVANVTFEPGCRNNWHIHHATKGGGQILLVTSGRGWYQEWGKEAQSLHAGDVVRIPTGVKHWHGAAKDSWFAHIAIEVAGENTSNEWLEAVSDVEYAKL